MKRKKTLILPDRQRAGLSLFERFWNKVNTNGPVPTCCSKEYGQCWLWSSIVNPNHYGRYKIYIDGQQHKLYAHRVAFYLAYGYWPRIAMHACDNKRCVRPSHLIDGNQSANKYDEQCKKAGGILLY